MTTSMHTGFARVTIVAPRARVDVSLPQTATVADLLPQLLHLVGEDPADRDAAPSEWILTRVGDPGVDTGRTVESLGVRDGEMLYLTPREEEPPPPVFDDVAEAVAHVAVTKRGRWSDTSTRRASLVATIVLFMLGAAVVIGSGTGPIGSAIALLLAVLLLGGGSALSRAGGDAAAGAVLGGCAVAYAFAGGLVLLSPGALIGENPHAQLVVGCAAMTMFAVIAAAAVGDFVAIFLAAAGVGGIGTLASLFGMVTGASGAGLAAGAAAAVLCCTPALPLLSLRLAGLTMPALPADATDFRRDDESLPDTGTLRQTELGDQYLAAMLGTVAAVLVVSQWLLIAYGSVLAVSLAAALTLTLLLRARVYPATAQRVVLLGGALLGGAALVLGLATMVPPALRLMGVLTGLVAAGGLALLTGLLADRRRRSPYWGRVLDIAEVVVLLSIIPLALGVLELYQYVRGLSG